MPEQWDTCNVKYMNKKELKKFGFAHKIKIDAKRQYVRTKIQRIKI